MTPPALKAHDMLHLAIPAMKALSAFLLALGFGFGQAGVAELVLADRGTAPAPIIIPKEATPFTKLAAQELAAGRWPFAWSRAGAH